MNPQLIQKQPIVTAEKLLQYKQAHGHLGAFDPPKTVFVCYQRSTLSYILQRHPQFQASPVTHFFVDPESRSGILGDWGVGAPGLAIKMEELIALGVRRFVAVGTAGALMGSHPIGEIVLCPKALAEDGVAHHYLPDGERIASADAELVAAWERFANGQALAFHPHAPAWSFSALFRETVEDMLRVHRLGFSVVEMEAASLYAIAKEKGVQALSLFVISDSITEESWTPKIKDPLMLENLHKLADAALAFCSSL